MNLEIRITRVTTIRQASGGTRTELVTDPTGHLWLNTQTADPSVLDALEAAHTEDELVVIEFDPQTQEIMDAYEAMIDVIFALGREEGGAGAATVHAMMCPSLLSLPSDHPRFNALYTALAQAHGDREDGARAALALRPGETEIQDVVIMAAETDEP